MVVCPSFHVKMTLNFVRTYFHNFHAPFKTPFGDDYYHLDVVKFDWFGWVLKGSLWTDLMHPSNELNIYFHYGSRLKSFSLINRVEWWSINMKKAANLCQTYFCWFERWGLLVQIEVGKDKIWFAYRNSIHFEPTKLGIIISLDSSLMDWFETLLSIDYNPPSLPSWVVT